MDKENAIIIILLILIVLSAGVYAVVTGVGFTLNHNDDVVKTNYTVNKTNTTVNNTTAASDDVAHDTGAVGPSTSDGDNSYVGTTYYPSSQSSSYQPSTDSGYQPQQGGQSETPTDSGQGSSEPSDSGQGDGSQGEGGQSDVAESG